VSSGYVYVLSNPSMPGLVKVGRSISGGHSRSKTFYQTGVATPFLLEFEIYAEDHEHLETMTHEALKACRVNPNREFFKIDKDFAIKALISTYYTEISNANFSVVFDDERTAAIDLSWMAHKLQLRTEEVLDCVTYIADDAIRQAVAARNKRMGIVDDGAAANG
jgi:hypothetical protein